MRKLIKKIKITTTISLVTGLHIGGSADSVEIGGIDNPVIKMATKGNQPYIPGSSLRGKMRCLLEQLNGATEIGGSDRVNKLFGFSKRNVPSKLIVRDAYLQEESVKELLACENLDMLFTEAKMENMIDRVKGTASNPRSTERVPAGVCFNAEFILNIWDDDNEEELLSLFEEGRKALENDYLGGSGSRGYGQIQFSHITQEDIPFNN